jgi:cation-transporting ATPase 13A1
MDVDVSKNLDDLVQKVSLHNPLPTIIHGYSLPFIFLYGLWFYLWVFVYGVEEYPEAGWISLAGIGLIQVLVSLSCYWSVHIRTFLTCTSTSNPLEAIYVKVVPTPNNGSSLLVPIQRTKVIFDNGHNENKLINFFFIVFRMLKEKL